MNMVVGDFITEVPTAVEPTEGGPAELQAACVTPSDVRCITCEVLLPNRNRIEPFTLPVYRKYRG